MKIKNKPSSIFYEKIYEKVKDFISTSDLISEKKIRLTIDNKQCADNTLMSDEPELGLISWSLHTELKKKNKYIIKILELKSLDFKNEEVMEILNTRCLKYIGYFKLNPTPEIITTLILLHEIGHIEYIESFMHYSQQGPRLLQKYEETSIGLYESVFRPWEISHVRYSISKLMYTPGESYAEMFSFKHFPYF